MDKLTYYYKENKNQLDHVADNVSGTPFDVDMAGQSTDNYTYNAIGQLTANAQDAHYFTYDVYGKVTGIYSDVDHTDPIALYLYDDKGYRIKKTVYSGGNTFETWYVRDASGNILSTYQAENGSTEIRQEERNIYGASRLGMAQNDAFGNVNRYAYELTDHLGNVRATITDVAVQDDISASNSLTGNKSILAKNSISLLPGFSTNGHEFEAMIDPTASSGGSTLLTATDYYPGGMAIPGRQFISGSRYRFGYQGQFAEKDDETGYNQFEARLYDSRINRWMIPDPAGQYWSSYMGMGNDWVNGVDPDGMFDTRFDAWWFKIWNGGGRVSFAKDKGEWYVGQQVSNAKGADITYQRIFEPDVAGPMAFGMSFEFALPKSKYFGGRDAVGWGFSIGVVADYKGISPYLVEKRLDQDAKRNISTTFSVTLDGTYYKPEVGNVYNDDIIGNGNEKGIGFGLPVGIATGTALDPQGNIVAKSYTFSRGLKFKGKPLSLDAGSAIFKTKTYIFGRLNNNFTFTKF